MKICVNAAEQQTRWRKEFEVKRNNVSPLMFWRQVEKAMQDRGEDLTDWIESYDAWIKPYQQSTYHEIDHEGYREAIKYMPYDFQVFDSSSYNVIMEFDFYNMRKGNGYFYFASNQ